MGQIRQPLPALRIFAVFSRYDDALRWAKEQIEAEYGNVALSSEPFAFDDTGYYASDMGADLKKQFFATEQLMDPAALVDAKHLANRWEQQYSEQMEHDEARPLNVDPGYLTEAKLVLASTKNHSHRIYLDRGIFAEITLAYSRGTGSSAPGWSPLDWTYPDYRRADFRQFFTECRHWLRDRLAAIEGPE